MVPAVAAGWFFAPLSGSLFVWARLGSGAWTREGKRWGFLPAIAIMAGFWSRLNDSKDFGRDVGPLIASYFGSPVVFALFCAIAVANEWLTGSDPKMIPQRLLMVIEFEAAALIAAVALLSF